ncbi:hypothetical protein V6Z11_A12G188700 [Gossypium hirsutum]
MRGSHSSEDHKATDTMKGIRADAEKFRLEWFMEEDVSV